MSLLRIVNQEKLFENNFFSFEIFDYLCIHILNERMSEKHDGSVGRATHS